MAEYLNFVCKNCGWKIAAPAEGGDFNMDSIVAYFKCLDCKKVFSRCYDMGVVVTEPETCSKCGSTHTIHWKPSDGCQECGGELENQGLFCLED
jgi:DNA-directed RNA polymerase subunit RPC12/RpoP